MIAVIFFIVIMFIAIFLWCAIAASTQYDHNINDEEQIFYIKEYHKKQEI